MIANHVFIGRPVTLDGQGGAMGMDDETQPLNAAFIWAMAYTYPSHEHELPIALAELLESKEPIGREVRLMLAAALRRGMDNRATVRKDIAWTQEPALTFTLQREPNAKSVPYHVTQIENELHIGCQIAVTVNTQGMTQEAAIGHFSNAKKKGLSKRKLEQCVALFNKMEKWVLIDGTPDPRSSLAHDIAQWRDSGQARLEFIRQEAIRRASTAS